MIDNILNEFYKKNIIKYFCILLITFFSIVLIVLAIGKDTYPIGESGSYMLATISIENRFSLTILPEDIEEAKVSFPEHSQGIQDYYINNRMPRDINGNVHPWYYGTYSFSCIPAKILLTFLGISQSYAFALTNAIIYSIALYIVYKYLKLSIYIKLFILLLLMINPAIYYIIWPSAEVFIFSFVVISLTFFINKEYKKAGLLISIAGTLNSTIMLVGIIYIIDYFINMLKNKNISLFGILILNIKDILLFGSTFIISLFPLIYNYKYFGTINLQSLAGFIQTEYMGDRFLAYLFDLNFGILPYLNFVFILFIIFTIISIFRNDMEFLLSNLAFYGTILLFSLMYHINCGMSGIARYNLWVMPIPIFFVMVKIDKIQTIMNKVICYLMVAFSLILSVVILLINVNYSYVEMSPQASIVLNKFPSLYNPFPFTFVSRIDKVDGGYYYNEPVIYTNEEGFVRKILVTPKTAEQVYDLVYADNKDLIILKEQVEKIKEKKGFQYISLNNNTKITELPLTVDFNPSLSIEKVNKSGVYHDEGDFAWISDNATITLKNDYNKEKIIIDFQVNNHLFLANKGKDIKFDIIINDKLIKTVNLIEPIRNRIEVDKKEISNEHNHIYKIQLRTNSYFNPFKMNLSSDNRKLSLALHYIGQE